MGWHMTGEIMDKVDEAGTDLRITEWERQAFYRWAVAKMMENAALGNGAMVNKVYEWACEKLDGDRRLKQIQRAYIGGLEVLIGKAKA